MKAGLGKSERGMCAAELSHVNKGQQRLKNADAAEVHGAAITL